MDLFDTGYPENLFYAALELRMGIEARLFEYLDASLNTHKESSKSTKEIVPQNF
jgi:hypothetical protein